MAYPGDVYSSKCSARDALALISGKWVMLILPALAQRPMRNGELLRRIDGISQKVLTQTLRQLERNGLLERLDLSEKRIRRMLNTGSAPSPARWSRRWRRWTDGRNTISPSWTPPASAMMPTAGARPIKAVWPAASRRCARSCRPPDDEWCADPHWRR